MKSLDISLDQKTNFSTTQNNISPFKVLIEKIVKKNKALKISTFLKLSIFAISLSALAAVTVHYPLLPNIVLNIFIPLVVLMLGYAKGFTRIKLGTLTIGRIVIVVTVLGFIQGNVGALVILWLLRINILEATVKDFMGKNYFNAFNGILVFSSSWLINIQWVDNSYPLIFPSMIILWALAYTIWNINFVYLNYNKSIFIYHIGILAAPLIYCLTFMNPAFWLIMRATTLTIAGTLQAVFEKKIISKLNAISSNKKLNVIATHKVQFVVLILVLGLSGATGYYTLF